MYIFFSHSQTACGILDTNCYEVRWDRGIARGLYHRVAYINHDCVPNCRKYFDSQRTMHIIAATDIEKVDELTLSYTSPLLSTSMRQVSYLEMTVTVILVWAWSGPP